MLKGKASRRVVFYVEFRTIEQLISNGHIGGTLFSIEWVIYILL